MPKGFAGMTPEKRREIARLGGLAVAQDKKHMSELGRKGGLVCAEKHDMAELGKKSVAARRIRKKQIDGHL